MRVWHTTDGAPQVAKTAADECQRQLDRVQAARGSQRRPHRIASPLLQRRHYAVLAGPDFIAGAHNVERVLDRRARSGGDGCIGRSRQPSRTGCLNRLLRCRLITSHLLTTIGLAVAISVSACTSAETSLSEPPVLPPPASTTNPPKTLTPEPPDSTPTASGTNLAPASTAPGSRPTESDSRPGPAQAERVKYVEWIVALGVAGGADTPEETVVALLARGDCALARRVAQDIEGAYPQLPTIYDAAAAACLAAFDGRSDLWPYAVSVAAQPTSTRDCLDRAVADLLRRLVDIHREDPNVQLKPQPADDGETFPCPRIIRLIPEHGPPQGSYPLRIVGVHLPPVVVIHFVQYIELEAVDTVITARSIDGTEAVISVPPQLPGAESEVAIYPDEWPYGPVNTPSFVYDKSPKIEPTSASTTSPDPTGDSANRGPEGTTDE